MGNFGPKIIKIGWAVQKLWPFWWAKSGRFSVFWKNVKKKWHFWTKIFFVHYLIGHHALFYSTVSSICFKKRYYRGRRNRWPAGPWPVYLRSGQSNWTKIDPLGQLIFSGQQFSFLPCHSISTDNRLMKGLGAIRAKIGPTSDVDKIFSKMYSQYVLFINKYS